MCIPNANLVTVTTVPMFKRSPLGIPKIFHLSRKFQRGSYRPKTNHCEIEAISISLLLYRDRDYAISNNQNNHVNNNNNTYCFLVNNNYNN